MKEKIKNLIADQLCISPDDIADDADIVNDLGADSLDAIELIMESEKEFNMTIPDEVAEQLKTVGDAIDYIEKNR